MFINSNSNKVRIKMNKFKTFFTAVSLVVLLGIPDRISCRKNEYSKQEAKIERKELTDGYIVEQTEPVRRTFRYDASMNTEWFYDEDTNVISIDKGCDGKVDRVYSLGWYTRDANTEEMFKKADEEFENVKKEMKIR